jgi:hypothetical protein
MNQKSNEGTKLPQVVWEDDGGRWVGKVKGVVIGHVAQHEFRPRGDEFPFMVQLTHSGGVNGQKFASADDVASVEDGKARLLEMAKSAIKSKVPSDVLAVVSGQTPDARASTVSVHVRDLAGPALEWAVAKCERLPIVHDPMGFKNGSEAGYWIWDKAPKGLQVKIGRGYTPSTNPAQGWPIIDRERPHLCPILLNGAPAYEAWTDGTRDNRYYGETALIAAMRCYVASKLGEVVDVPAELVLVAVGE